MRRMVRAVPGGTGSGKRGVTMPPNARGSNRPALGQPVCLLKSGQVFSPRQLILGVAEGQWSLTLGRG
jgi:hypothetical protein